MWGRQTTYFLHFVCERVRHSEVKWLPKVTQLEGGRTWVWDPLWALKSIHASFWITWCLQGKLDIRHVKTAFSSTLISTLVSELEELGSNSCSATYSCITSGKSRNLSEPEFVYRITLNWIPVWPASWVFGCAIDWQRWKTSSWWPEEAVWIN